MNTIEEVSKLAERYEALTAQLAEQNAAVAQTEKLIRQMVEETIPEAMDDIGLQEITTSLGNKLVIENKVRANISKERAPAAMKWLRENGHGKLIKRVLSVAFAKGEDEEAQKLLKGLEAQKLDVDDKEGVHASTLTSFVKSQMEDGFDFEDGGATELLGIHVQRFAKFSK